MARYQDREEAALELSRALPAHIDNSWLTLALPRGGVPIAAAISRNIGADLDLVIVRKVGAPGNPELALAAVTGPERDQMVVNDSVAAAFGLSHEEVWKNAAEAIAQVQERRQRWKLDERAHPVEGRDVLLVDDGIATGTTLRAALQAVRKKGARSIVAAVPVALGDAIEALGDLEVELVCPFPNAPLGGVGAAYEAFPQVSDGEVTQIMGEARKYSRPIYGGISAGSTPSLAA